MVAQATSLGWGVVIGLFIGLMYDLFRILRVRVKIPVVGHVLDLLFWAVVTLAIFLWSQMAWGGRVRYYGIASLMVGAVIYFSTFTHTILWLGFLLADFVQFLLQLATVPILALVAAEKFFQKIIKNLFSFWLKWYRIRGMTNEMDSAMKRRENVENPVSGKEGGVRREVEIRRAVDEVRGGGRDHLSGVQFNHRSRQNPKNPRAPGSTSATGHLPRGVQPKNVSRFEKQG